LEIFSDSGPAEQTIGDFSFNPKYVVVISILLPSLILSYFLCHTSEVNYQIYFITPA
jgi:hypothetical protein